MAILHDPWTGATVHEDSLPTPIVPSDANGDYVIHRENGRETYKALEFPADELPEAPSANGAYVLTCTVSSGTDTLSWESAE